MALQDRFCLKSMGEETQKLLSGNSDPARLMDICAGLTLIVLLYKEGSIYAFMGKAMPKGEPEMALGDSIPSSTGVLCLEQSYTPSQS